MSIDLLYMHTATVKPYLGSGPTGARYGDPVTLEGLLQDGEMITPESGGLQIVNKTTFYTHLENADACPVNSLLSCNGRNMTVTAIRRADGGWLLGAVTHLEVDCT